MPRGRRSKLRARERRQRLRAEARARAQAEAGAPAAAVGGPPPGPGPAPGSGPAAKARGHVQRSRGARAAEGAGQELLAQKAAVLVEHLLLQYKRKEPIRRADMLRVVHKRYRKDFPEVLRRAAERMDLFFGLELKEVKPNGNSYILVNTQGDAGDGPSGWSFPKKGVLMPLLSVIFLNGNRASEEEIWGFLNTLGIYDGKSDFIFGEPRKLITQDLVQEKYLLYQQVPGSDPPRFEFLWGPRAQAETSKMKVLEFLAKLNDTVPSAFAPHYEEALKEEEERAQTRARAAPAPGAPPKAGGRPRATPGRHPRPL
ncbi:melanoma-associated antigen B4-like [Molossus molossus]|uniref:melanoma-associated antigen B4-like n=1 Tax=Molossus molossus TaxID=27622 RepID=UPI001746FE2C|nr:melanoma-associated antigen B4-like [Molossus molossus]